MIVMLLSSHRLLCNVSIFWINLPENVRVVCDITHQRNVLLEVMSGGFRPQKPKQVPASFLTPAAVFFLPGAPLLSDPLSPSVKAAEETLVAVQLVYHSPVVAHTLTPLINLHCWV